MNTCGKCGAELKQTGSFSSITCPRCGAVVDDRRTIQEEDPAATRGDIPPVAPPAAEKSATLDDVRIDRTMDFGPADPPATQKPAPADEKKPGTVYPLPHLHTVDFSLESSASMEMGLPIDPTDPPPKPAPVDPKKPGTVYPLPHQHTVDFSLESSASMEMGLPIDEPPVAPGSPTKQPGILATFDSDVIGESLADRLSVAWGEQLEDDANPRMTIKGKPGGGEKNDQTLVVNTRNVHDARGSSKMTKMPTLADYELLELLGEGGMGVVYTARQASIDRTVAVKMLKPHLSRSRDLQQKFLSEAVVTGDLDHPNIVPMYDLGKNEAGDLFYAMKRVEGTPWSKAIGERSQQENVEILLKVCDAVAFAHARGVVHRDLKPENVMLGEFGEVLVMDWGLAYSTADFRKVGEHHADARHGRQPGLHGAGNGDRADRTDLDGERHLPARRDPLRDRHRQAAARRRQRHAMPDVGGAERDPSDRARPASWSTSPGMRWPPTCRPAIRRCRRFKARFASIWRTRKASPSRLAPIKTWCALARRPTTKSSLARSMDLKSR